MPREHFGSHLLSGADFFSWTRKNLLGENSKSHDNHRSYYWMRNKRRRGQVRTLRPQGPEYRISAWNFLEQRQHNYGTWPSKLPSIHISMWFFLQAPHLGGSLRANPCRRRKSRGLVQHFPKCVPSKLVLSDSPGKRVPRSDNLGEHYILHSCSSSEFHST